MNRKWIALGGICLAVCLSAGLTLAQDEEGTPLHQVMEKVQKHNATILRGVRNASSYAKTQEEVAASAVELVKLGKEFRGMGKGPADAQKKEVAEWEKLTDEYLKKAESFSALVAKPDTTQSQAKDAYKNVSKDCTKCHEVFRVEEEGF